MDSLFFWIIVLSFLVPFALRMYRKSVRGNQDKGMTGGFPGQPGGYPGQFPGAYPRQDKTPRDGYTQQDYFRGGFGPAGAEPPRKNEAYPDFPYPGQPYPGQPYPGQQGYQPPMPYGNNPEYLDTPPAPGQPPAGPQQQPGPAVPPPAPPSPQGYRARRLAELDQRYSNGELNLEDYMAQRAEIMKG